MKSTEIIDILECTLVEASFSSLSLKHYILIILFYGGLAVGLEQEQEKLSKMTQKKKQSHKLEKLEPVND